MNTIPFPQPAAVPLTPKQQKIFDFILEQCLDGQPPTIREIMVHFGIRSPNGVNVYVDLGEHQSRRDTNLPVTAKFGRTANPRVINDGIHVDLHFNPKHEFAEPFLWACENDPSQYGFSHFASVKWENQPSGGRVAESIQRVIRIDIVGDPATTTSVFESIEGAESVATETDPRAIASTITSPDALTSFLAALFDGLPSGSFTNESKSSALTALMAKYSDSPEDPGANPEKAVESLRTQGKLGQWAGTFIAESLAVRAKAERVKKAGELCDAEKLPAHLRTDAFVDLVAESLATPEKAKALIADRIAVGKPAPAGTPTAESTGGAKTTDRGGDGNATKSVADIVGAYAGGRHLSPRRN